MEIGAPDDEFDIESLAISRQIRSGQSAEKIATIIAKVFNTNFEEHYDSFFFFNVAKEIQKDLVF